MSITGVLILLFIFFVPFTGGAIVLQIFLSRRESWWPGLILPILPFLFSIFMIWNIAAVGNWLPQLIAVLLIFNIPTAALLIVYFICRDKFRKRKQMERMDIQDL